MQFVVHWISFLLIVASIRQPSSKHITGLVRLITPRIAIPGRRGPSAACVARAVPLKTLSELFLDTFLGCRKNLGNCSKGADVCVF